MQKEGHDDSHDLRLVQLHGKQMPVSHWATAEKAIKFREIWDQSALKHLNRLVIQLRMHVRCQQLGVFVFNACGI